MLRNIIVTGDNKGLGLEICRRLLETGTYKVLGFSRTKSEDTDKLIQKYGTKYTHYDLDLRDSDQLSANLATILKNHGPIHGLVNNAALAYDDLISNINLNRLREMFAVNVFSPIMLTKLIIRNMLFHRVKGSIVMISSVSTKTGYKGLAMYGSSKGALEAFSKNAAREWGEKGIRINCVIPGFMETQMTSSLDDLDKKRIYSRTSLKSPVKKDSVAHLVEFLLSAKSESITGSNLGVDCGV